MPCIDAKRLGVELAARQNIIDETFKLDPGTGKRPEVWPWSGRPNGNIAEGKDAEEDHHTRRAESVGKPSQKAANMQAQTYRWAI